MAGFAKTLSEAAISILIKQYPGILDKSWGKDDDSKYTLDRNGIKVDKENESGYENFHSYIKGSIEYYKKKKNLTIHQKLLCDFQGHFEEAFEKLKKFLNADKEKAYQRFYNDKLFEEYENELLNLAIWDDDYVNDPNGVLSPFGPLLVSLQEYKGGRKIGILRAIEQQLGHPSKNNQVKAQMLAKQIHEHFWAFAKHCKFPNLKLECKSPPILQLCAGGAALIFGGSSVPAFIVIDKTKADKFSGFSALPHESGHNVSLSFKDKSLVDEITTGVKKLNIPHLECWKMWIEECLADAIGVAIIKEGEIYSLAHLFSNYPPNTIFEDRIDNKVDVHPIPYIRVLLTIEVGRILGINQKILNIIKAKWIDFGEKIYTNIPPNKIKILSHYEIHNYIVGVEKVATALINTPYTQLNNCTVKNIFAKFKSNLADKLRNSIIREQWL